MDTFINYDSAMINTKSCVGFVGETLWVEYREAADTISTLEKQVAAAQEDARCAWANAGILERARQAQDATIADLRAQLDAAAGEPHADRCAQSNRLKAQLADLRERHEAFVRKVCSEAQRAADLATCTSLTSYLANEILALCGAELGKEGK